MNRFVLKNTFIKIYISLFNKYFYKNKQSKLCFEDCVAVLNIIYFLYGGSRYGFSCKTLCLHKNQEMEMDDWMRQ